MASHAHVAHSSQHYEMVRAQIAEQSFEHVRFTIELLKGLAARAPAAFKTAFKRWAEAHHRAVEERMLWELALSDRRVMEEIRAIRDHAAQEAAR